LIIVAAGIDLIWSNHRRFLAETEGPYCLWSRYKKRYTYHIQTESDCRVGETNSKRPNNSLSG